jgi:hypothetical protein
LPESIAAAWAKDEDVLRLVNTTIAVEANRRTWSKFSYDLNFYIGASGAIGSWSLRCLACRQERSSPLLNGQGLCPACIPNAT